MAYRDATHLDLEKLAPLSQQKIIGSFILLSSEFRAVNFFWDAQISSNPWKLGQRNIGAIAAGPGHCNLLFARQFRYFSRQFKISNENLTIKKPKTGKTWEIFEDNLVKSTIWLGHFL